MKWDYRLVRRRSWNTTFHKGTKRWPILVFIAFIYAFIGASNAFQVSLIDTIDRLLGAKDNFLPHSVDTVKEYLTTAPLLSKLPSWGTEVAAAVADSLTSSSEWLLKILASNSDYFSRNVGEVVVFLVIGAILSAMGSFFVRNVTIIGRNRYIMENRVCRKVRLRRLLAPYHKGYLWNIVKVMFCYRVTLTLWWLTFFGGIYKSYQYFFVPYILAENPSVKWKEAKRLSAQMTKGYKRKIFLTQLSYTHIWFLKLIPIVGLLVPVPLEMSLNAEFYFTLRNNPAISSDLLRETAFSGAPYTEDPTERTFVLQDLRLIRRHAPGERSRYGLLDYIFLFFVFCFIGWVWECGLYIVRDQMLVNRGTLYGPWIPIYGVGGVGMVFFLDRFKEHKVKLILLELGLCAVLEYASSLLLDLMFNASYWDYNDMLFNLNGRICLAGLVAFALGGAAAIYLIAPALSDLTGKISKKKRIVIASILCAAFVADIVCGILFGFNSGAGVGGKFS